METNLNPKEKHEYSIVKQLSEIARKQRIKMACEVIIRWTPEHISVWGNLNK